MAYAYDTNAYIIFKNIVQQLGRWICHWNERENLNFYQRIAGYALGVGNRRISTMKEVVLPGFISFRWEGGSRCREGGWTLEVHLFTKPRNM